MLLYNLNNQKCKRLVDLYPSLSIKVQELLKLNVKPMIHSLAAKSLYMTELESIIQSCTKENIDLHLVFIHEAKDKLSDRIMQLFKSRILEWKLEGDYIICVLHVLSKVDYFIHFLFDVAHVY